tara:strand:- start:795 stop:1637 length:843 start_codon:yes stop_codon:yes gene_type:complete
MTTIRFPPSQKNVMKKIFLLFSIVFVSACSTWQPLFNGKDLTGWEETDYAGRGSITVKDGELRIDSGEILTGIHWKDNATLPRTNYEFAFEAKKLDGSDFFALVTFPVGDNYASLVPGGWGGAVTGISSINSMDASENDTTLYIKYEKNIWYKFRVRVTPREITVWLDPHERLFLRKDTPVGVFAEYAKAAGIGRAEAEATLRRMNPKLDELMKPGKTIIVPGETKIITANIHEQVVAMRPGEVELSAPFGFATFQTSGVIRNVRLRRLPMSVKKNAYGK